MEKLLFFFVAFLMSQNLFAQNTWTAPTSGTLLNTVRVVYGQLYVLGLSGLILKFTTNGKIWNSQTVDTQPLRGIASTEPNSGNGSVIVNNTQTSIFTYGGTYDGTVNDIYTKSIATTSAGAFTAPNTFTPSGLPAGSQTLYAKITPSGGACEYVVPFTLNNLSSEINLKGNNTLIGNADITPSVADHTYSGSVVVTNVQYLVNNSITLNPQRGGGSEASNGAVCNESYATYRM